jgi:replicative DNA helicase
MVMSIEDARNRQKTGTARVPPHNTDAERQLLGSMLLSPAAVAAAGGLVRSEDFYVPIHGHIHQAIGAVDQAGHPVDVITVAEQLRTDGLLETIGGLPYLTELGDPAIGSSRNAERYATIVAQAAQMRAMIAAAGEIAEMGYSNPGDPAAALDLAQALIFDLTATGSRPTVETAGDAVTRALDQLERLYNSDGELVGVPTGLIDLDHLLTGMRKGQLITAGARPGMGKTSLVAGSGLYAAMNGTPTLIVSIEMTVEELVMRMFSSEGRVDNERVRTGRLAERDWPRISQAVANISNSQLWFLDAATATLATLRSEVRRLAAQVPLGLVVVDYLQMLLPDSKSGDRRVDVDELAAGVKRLAREFDIPFLVAAQLSRNVEYRADKRPILSDFRESGAIENFSDVVIGIYRDEYYKPDSDDKGVAELLVLKQRNGPQGTVRVAWQDHYTRFANMAGM